MKICRFTVLAFWVVIKVQQLSACDFPPKSLLQRSPGEYLEFHGKYVNQWWGYSVVIPNGLIGYDDADQANHHGVELTIGQKQQGYINVYAEANSAEYSKAYAAADALLGYLRKDRRNIVRSYVAHSNLGSLSAVLLNVTYTCPGSHDRYRMVAAVALEPGKGVVYEVILYSAVSRYQRDRVIFDKVLSSWKYIGR